MANDVRRDVGRIGRDVGRIGRDVGRIGRDVGRIGRSSGCRFLVWLPFSRLAAVLVAGWLGRSKSMGGP